MTARSIVMLGALLAAIGCVCPLAHMPIVGDFTYIANGHGDGLIVIGISAVAFLLAAIRIASAGIAAGAIIGFLLLRLQHVFNEAVVSMHTSAGQAGMFGGLVEMMASSVYLEFGFWIILTGAVVMVVGGAAALVVRRRPDPNNIATPPSPT